MSLEEELASWRRTAEALEVEKANLEHRLELVTGDPESLESRLLSKHNALRMASQSLDEARVYRNKFEAALQLANATVDRRTEKLTALQAKVARATADLAAVQQLWPERWKPALRALVVRAREALQ